MQRIRVNPTTAESQVTTKRVPTVTAESSLATPVARSASIGRSLDNDIVVADVLASRHHAYLAPTPVGAEIRDAHSINGTFVNGIRVGSAILSEGDVVTIGNVDLLFSGGNLVRQTAGATPAGGLEVNAVSFAVDGKALLENVSLTARPG
ncbi:FHA domain-containing protein, partial [Mycobacterium sp. 1423905.2]|uniref:FHA domain-containing protein n=1 Tax=Mycobacterium sp. 1423905.2 TaxID=1856859 RepID=UPI000A747205